MNWHKVFMWSMIYGLLILKGRHAKVIKKRGIMDSFNDGLKVAGQMFGLNTAADVANLVAKAFSHNNGNRNKTEDGEHNNESQEAYQQQPEETKTQQFQTKASTATPAPVGANLMTSNLITNMLRLVGFDASKLGALAINALIMLASALGNTIMGTTNSHSKFSSRNPNNLKNNENTEEEENAENRPEEKYAPNEHQPRSLNDITTIEWFLKNSSGKLKRILKEATATELSDKLIDMITNQESKEGQASCLKMLVCKSSPFIWGMQKSLRKHTENKENKSKEHLDDEVRKGDSAPKRLFDVKHFFKDLPSFDEYQEHGELCEKLYSPHCNVTNLYDKNN